LAMMSTPVNVSFPRFSTVTAETALDTKHPP
jgi:hypothetical protein